MREREKARGNNDDLSYVTSKRKEEIKSGTSGCGSFVVPNFQPVTSIDRLQLTRLFIGFLLVFLFFLRCGIHSHHMYESTRIILSHTHLYLVFKPFFFPHTKSYYVHPLQFHVLMI